MQDDEEAVTPPRRDPPAGLFPAEQTVAAPPHADWIWDDQSMEQPSGGSIGSDEGGQGSDRSIWDEAPAEQPSGEPVRYGPGMGQGSDRSIWEEAPAEQPPGEPASGPGAVEPAPREPVQAPPAPVPVQAPPAPVPVQTPPDATLVQTPPEPVPEPAPPASWRSLGEIWNPPSVPARGAGVGSSSLEKPEPWNVRPGRAGRAQHREDSATGEGRSDLTRLARGGSINLVGAIANGILGFVLILVVTRSLHPGPAGVFFEAIALFQILNNVTQLGADDGMVRGVSRLRTLGRVQDLRRTLRVALGPVLVFASLVAVAAFVFAPQLSHLFVHGKDRGRAGDLVPYIRLMIPVLPLAAASSILLSGTRGFGTMLPTVVVENFGKPGLRPVFILGVITLGFGVAGLALSWSILIAAGFLVGLVWIIRLLRRAERAQSPQGPRQASRGELFGEFWRFSAPRGLAAVFSITVFWLDTLLLGALRDTKQASIYTAASRYALLGYLALGAVQQAIAPLVSKLITEGNRERATNVYHTATQWLMTPAWPICLSLAVFAPAFLRVFRPQYEVGQTVLLILALAMMVSTAAGPNMITLLMAGKSTWSLLNSAVGLGVNLTLNFLLIPRYGMNGAALAWAASMVVVNTLAVAEIGLLLRLRPFGPEALTVAIPALILYGGGGLAARAAFGTGFPVLLAFEALATALYVAVLYRFRHHLQLPVLREALRVRSARLGSSQRFGAPTLQPGARG